MTHAAKLIELLSGSGADSGFSRVYGKKSDVLQQQKQRYLRLVQQFQKDFPADQEIYLFSAPGRTEVGGNHTDHNAGRVLAAAVNLDVAAVVSRTDDSIITVHSEGYAPLKVDTHQLHVVETEKNSSAALIRGVCARLSQLGMKVGGFNASMVSDVPKGSGLSSSAAYEVLIGTILSGLYNGGGVDPVMVAQIGQYAENIYFGKPCGLMDQTTSSVGGFVTIDFKDAALPVVHKVDYDFSASKYALVVIETGGDHADLTDDYASIRQEMGSVARFLGGQVLREFTEAQLLAALPAMRGKVTDRAILRAFHFFEDDQRVVKEVQALEANDFARFLELVNESGRSSWMQLQNSYSTRNPTQQGVALAQAVSEKYLKGVGAWRVHGGGFAGTVQVFVLEDKMNGFIHHMEAVFGKGSCYPLSIRPVGAVQIELD